MKFFWCQGIFFVNFDFKNGCKNEFEVNNEKSESRFKNRVPLKIDFRADWVHPDSLGVKHRIEETLHGKHHRVGHKISTLLR